MSDEKKTLDDEIQKDIDDLLQLADMLDEKKSQEVFDSFLSLKHSPEQLEAEFFSKSPILNRITQGIRAAILEARRRKME